MSRWTDFNNWMEKHEHWLMPLTLMFLAISLALCFTGCGSRGLLPEGPKPGDPSEAIGLGAQLASVGSYFTWAGLVIAGVALVACLSPLRSIAIVAGELGGGLALVGGFFVWLSDNIWLVVLSCVLTGLAYAWYRRAWLRRWLDRIKAQAVKS